METMAGDGLGRICSGGGWTYGALWCSDCRDPRLLVLEESYHGEHSEKYFDKVFNQVHLIGQGTIGEVAISGKHRWINCDNNPDIFQTIAIIPLPSIGVLLLGSTQKIRESSDFIAQAQHLLRQFRIKRRGYLNVDMSFSHPQDTFDSVISSLDYSRFKNSVSSYDSAFKQRQGNHLSSECSSLASGLLSLGSQIDDRSQTSSLKPYAISMPVSTSSGPFSGHGNLFYGTPSFSGASYQAIDQQAASTKARILLPPSSREPHSNFKCSSNLFAASFSSSRAKDIDFSSTKVFPFTLDLAENYALIHSNTKYTGHQIHNRFMNDTIHSCEQEDDQLNNSLSIPSVYNYPDVPFASSAMAGNVSIACVPSSSDRGCDRNLSIFDARNQPVSDSNLFDGMELDLIPIISRQGCWEDMALPVVGNGRTELEMGSVAGSGKGLFSDSSGFEQLLDAVVAGNANVSASCISVGTTNSLIFQDSRRHISTTIKHGDAHIAAASPLNRDVEKLMHESPSDARPDSHAHTWIDDTCSVNGEGPAPHQPERVEEPAKVVRKRARPGESARPRPKDRQQIQDRVKELREIVPDCAKCSIDSLLDRTIKHMLFLQSVTKYVDKLKQADEPKLIGEESGVVLKDNTNGGVGGATWAYEVARQTMVCPIMVEDVHPSGQMLVEMLCEERGFFLEIADVVRGFGLTILKGDMEIRERKVWARFLVEANRNVTRMDIFLSLVQFLQQASSFRANESHSRAAVSTELNSLSACQQQSTASIPIGLAAKLH